MRYGGHLTVSRKIHIGSIYPHRWILDTELMELSVEAYASEKHGNPELAISFDALDYKGKEIRETGCNLVSRSRYASFYHTLKRFQKLSNGFFDSASQISC